MVNPSGRALAGVGGFEFSRKHGCLSLVSDVSCRVEVSASNPSPVQGIPIECDVSDCDYEALIMRLWSNSS